MDSNIIEENFDIEALYEDVFIDELKNYPDNDGLPPIEVLTGDDYFKYSDPEETFSIIFNRYPWEPGPDSPWHQEADPDRAHIFIIERTLEPMPINPAQFMYYFKIDESIAISEDEKSMIATRLVATKSVESTLKLVKLEPFEPAYEVVEFNTNGVRGTEYRFFAPLTDLPDRGFFARVRIVTNDDYLYAYRIFGDEETIFGLEGDRFFGSFELK